MTTQRPAMQPHPRMSPAAFRTVMKDRGWTTRTLSARWAIPHGQLQAQIATTSRSLRWDHALLGLPQRDTTDKRQLTPAPRAPDQFRLLVRDAGWTFRDLAPSWGVTANWLSKLAMDTSRPTHWDDAVGGLPQRTPTQVEERLSGDAFRAAIASKGWTLRALATRWDVTENWIRLVAKNTSRPGHWDDAVRALPPYKR